jgi:PAS domain S-box-containing protein
MRLPHGLRGLRRWLGASIVRRVSLAAFLLTLGFALAVGAVSYGVTREVLRQSLSQRLRDEAAAQAREVAEPLAALAREISTLSESGFLTNALVDTMGRERYVAPFLREYRFSPPVPVAIYLCDHRGRVLETNRLDRPAGVEAGPWLDWLLVTGTPYAGMAVRDGRARLVLAYPVHLPRTEGIEGALVGELDLVAAFAARRRQDESVAVRLLDREGRVLAGGDRAWEDMVSARQSLSWPGAGLEPLEAIGLQVESGQPRRRAMGALRWLALSYGLGGLLLAAAALAAARLVAGRLMSPIAGLNQAARDAAARASFDVSVAVAGNDQIAELGATFNHMLERLREATEARYALEQARRAEAEGALHLAHEALEQFADGVVILSEDGTVLYSNEAAARMRGLPRDRIIGQRHWELPRTTTSAPTTPAEFRAELEKLGRVGVVSRTARFAAPEREEPVDVRLARIEFGGKQFMVVTFREASDRLRAEQATRMASLGSLAAGVAHEINNPLAFVAANLEYAEGALRRPPGADGALQLAPASAAEVQGALADALEGARRVKEVVRALRVYSRPTEGQRAPVSVEAEIRAALDLAHNEIRHRAQVVTQIEWVPPVVAGEHQLGQVFLNLLVNAAQAIPEGHSQENAIRVSCRLAPDGRVMVEISDTGEGIPPERLARIFEPFFTTKAGVGTGLGLSICHGIVTGLGGQIEVASEVGRGTRFRLLFPPAEAPPAPRLAAPAPAARRLRLLVIDDEASVGRALQRVLGASHEVVALTSAREALARVEAGERFDAVLCDLMMPEMSGIEFHRTLTRTAPALAARMVLMTGGAFTAAAREFLEETRIPCLEKPFEAEAALRAVAGAAG